MISNDRQLNLSLIGEVREMKDLPYNEVAICNTPYDAVRRCIRGITHAYIADLLGMKQGTFTSMVNRDINEITAKKNNKEFRPRNFDLHLVNQIQTIAGNRCISQYFDLESKGQLFRQQREQSELTIEEKAAAWDRSQSA